MEQIIEAVGQYGFPIVMAGIMAWYVKYTEDKHREERQQMTKDHKDETTTLKEAIVNNTLALQHLTDYMQRGVDND